ncbi:MAG: ATP-binding protein [Bacteroidales bacterium]|nr:ATP-binding protein [Candidatus Physcocola equi]
MIIGREKEIATLQELLHSDESQFVAVYGRRRVGKTYLIREAYNYDFVFQHTGTYGATRKQQLSDFRDSLYNAGMDKCAMPKTWSEAFLLLWNFLKAMPVDGKKKVIFIDELPWMDTAKSNFVHSLDHFWNAWATTRKDIILVICGSSTSWIIDNVIMNYGGLHNRLTCQINLQPFSLYECKQYCESKNLGYKDRQILEAYMALGGIPYYFSFLKKGQSVAQNFDRMFFQPGGELIQEFNALYASLFKQPKRHISIITALASKKCGQQREELLKATKLSDNTDFTKALQELEQCGFIRKYTTIGKKSKDAIYQLIDNYTLFYFDFISENTNGDQHFWSSQANCPIHTGWAGRAFERVCMQHISQIKDALGFSAVISSVHSWTYKGPKDPISGKVIHKGAQIDLLIDRNDDTINLCEIKFTNSTYTITEEEDEKIRNRRETFIRETGTEKTVLVTMITAFGLTPGGYANDIHCQLTMNDLFRPSK